MALRELTEGRSVDPLPRTKDFAGPDIALSNVTRVFGAVPAIVRLDLAVRRGETVVLRGPNGAGKSTLLRIIATAISPTYGGGTVLGYRLGSQREQIRRWTELLGHRTRLYDDLSAEENLRFVCTMFGCDQSGVGAALERVGLGDVVRERVRGFSQGMRQRVALARVVIRRPELLLLDEPYAGLDEEAKDLVDDVVDETRARGGTVVLSTHDLARGGTARMVRMEGGRIL